MRLSKYRETPAWGKANEQVGGTPPQCAKSVCVLLTCVIVVNELQWSRVCQQFAVELVQHTIKGAVVSHLGG